MKILIQRVSQASVEVEDSIVGSIGCGVLVLIGITHNDTAAEAVWLANKLANLRIFKDSQGKINQSLLDCQGSALIISQFTLYADCDEGRRPSFIQAAPPEMAIPLYEAFIHEVQKIGIPVATGIFGAYMKITLTNDGPVTILLEK